jgi:hypothetical protein
MGRSWEKMHESILWRNLKKRHYLEGLGVDGKIIIKQVIRKQAERVWTEFFCSEQGPMAGSCGRGNEHSGSIKCREFLN